MLKEMKELFTFVFDSYLLMLTLIPNTTVINMLNKKDIMLCQYINVPMDAHCTDRINPQTYIVEADMEYNWRFSTHHNLKV